MPILAVRLTILAPYSKKYRDFLQRQIFILKEDEYYYDRYGFEYKIEGIGIEQALLGYEQPNGEYEVFYVDSNTLQKPGNILQLMDIQEKQIEVS